ncbi:hypothetical protein LOAG_13649 [Loa loa]|uniref:G-protein coupled receptors family 1 profile domain-containing protein n=1 Tax=Loa loa TaxID=7209 RepID=A0A1S0TJ54_LOALO|nr:hypothetical protein LOAG_13649 [Loa loa]EFO14865.1 hypothetical protein LOAG_13649 [Loa loa]
MTILLHHTNDSTFNSSILYFRISANLGHNEYFRLRDVYNSYFYLTLTLLSSTASLSSIILMVIVVAMLRRRFGAQFLSNTSHNRGLTRFLENQRRYTHTTLISCCFTFCLVVVPSIVQCICMVDSSAQSQIIAMCCIYTPLINSFNMVLLFMYRQKDFRNAAIHGLKWVFCRKKHHIHPAIPVGFR